MCPLTMKTSEINITHSTFPTTFLRVQNWCLQTADGFSSFDSKEHPLVKVVTIFYVECLQPSIFSLENVWRKKVKEEDCTTCNFTSSCVQGVRCSSNTSSEWSLITVISEDDWSNHSTCIHWPCIARQWKWVSSQSLPSGRIVLKTCHQYVCILIRLAYQGFW